MKVIEQKKMIQAAAKESGIIISNYSKIKIIHHVAKPGNPWTMEHDYIFEYNGKRYGQTARVTGYYSTNCKHDTRVINCIGLTDPYPFLRT